MAGAAAKILQPLIFYFKTNFKEKPRLRFNKK